LGLDLPHRNSRFEIHSLRPARRTGPDGESRIDVVIEVTQKRPVYSSAARQRQAEGLPAHLRPPADFDFRGGATLLVDLETSQLRYAIRKNIADDARLERQRAFLRDDGGCSSLHALYLHKQLLAAPFALLHRAGA